MSILCQNAFPQPRIGNIPRQPLHRWVHSSPVLGKSNTPSAGHESPGHELQIRPARCRKVERKEVLVAVLRATAAPPRSSVDLVRLQGPQSKLWRSFDELELLVQAPVQPFSATSWLTYDAEGSTAPLRGHLLCDPCPSRFNAARTIGPEKPSFGIDVNGYTSPRLLRAPRSPNLTIRASSKRHPSHPAHLPLDHLQLSPRIIHQLSLAIELLQHTIYCQCRAVCPASPLPPITRSCISLPAWVSTHFRSALCSRRNG